jgi:putative methyltransferase (TIGR04325 family)
VKKVATKIGLKMLGSRKVKNADQSEPWVDTLPLWSGNFASWSEAASNCTGYDSANILQECKDALLKVKTGQAAYERDSVLFDTIQYSWGLLAGLQRAAIGNDGYLSVIDFGGSLGSTYYQNKAFLNNVKKLEWSIVEQENFVNCGKEYFGNSELKFYKSLEECLLVTKPHILLLSGVLQYLEYPYKWIEKFLNHGFSYIILDRTSFVKAAKDILTVQQVPEEIYAASYPAWFFGERLMNSIHEKYDSLATFDNGFTPPAVLNGGMQVYWQGVILIRKK